MTSRVHVGLSSAPLGALHKSGFQTATLAAIHTFVHATEPTRIIRRRSDDLPAHVKGDAWFYRSSRGFEDKRGYVVTLKNQTTGHDENSHIEFVKDLYTEEEH